MLKFPPLVLAIGGHDPSGGAGLQADIETCAALDCRALTLVTALTTQNTCRVTAIHPQPASSIREQCHLLMQESHITTVKIGLLAHAEIAETIAALLVELKPMTVILDPVLISGSGASLVHTDLIHAMKKYLLPRCTLITPNGPEARALTGLDDLAECAAALIDHGCGAVLITGGHESDAQVINRLYDAHGLINTQTWPRLAGNYHGSGCTLASAIAAICAHGQALTNAVMHAQTYTWYALKHAFYTGRCQLTPNRFHAQCD